MAQFGPIEEVPACPIPLEGVPPRPTLLTRVTSLPTPQETTSPRPTPRGRILSQEWRKDPERGPCHLDCHERTPLDTKSEAGMLLAACDHEGISL
jgi:hypothetical protein